MRLDANTFREISDAIVRNRSRSLLTGFGIFWGLFMLLVLLGAGNGVKALLYKNFEGFASNALLIGPGQTSKPYKGFQDGRTWNMTMNDVTRLKQLIPEAEVVTPNISVWGDTAIYDSETSSCSISGVNSDYEKVESPVIKYGRYLNQTDEDMERRVCVIGSRVFNDLFPDGEDPCGCYIQVGSVFFQVVGVNVSEAQVSINGSNDEKVTIPISVARKLFGRGDNVDLICITAPDGVKVSSLEPRVRRIMAREHMFDPEDDAAMMAVNTEQLFKLMDSLFKGVDFLILLIGLGTLLAGAIGVSNIMMVTVKERTVEIGIRRAIGATPKDILSQIMMESVCLTIVSGMFSVVLSVLILNIVEKATHQPGFVISLWLALGATALLAALGVLAGLAPALRAMNIKPVEAMRDE